MQDPRKLPDLTRNVYRAFLRTPGAAPENLARALHVTTGDVALALDTLHGVGLVRRSGTHYVPVRPDAVKEDMLRREEAELDRRRLDLLDARSGLSAEMDDWFAGRESVTAVESEHVTGPDAVRRVRELCAGVRSELLAVVTEADAGAAATLREKDVALRRSGVAVRTIYPVTVREQPHAWAYARGAAAAGELVRLGDDVPARLLVRDRELAVIPLGAAGLDDGVHVVRSRPVVAALAALFELSWARATPAFPASYDTGERERHLVDLLASGAKDDTIARHLRLNVRTVRRDVANLLTDLGAETRFQAGVHAARRGWV